MLWYCSTVFFMKWFLVNCQHLSSEMNQARQKFQRNIRIESWNLDLFQGTLWGQSAALRPEWQQKTGVVSIGWRSPLEGANFSLKCSKLTSRSRPCWRNTRQACLHHRCSILQNGSTGMQQPGDGVFWTVCRRTMCVYIVYIYNIYPYIYIQATSIWPYTYLTDIYVYIYIYIYMYVTDTCHDNPWHGCTHKNCPLCILDICISPSYVHTYWRTLSYINRW